MAKDGRSKSSRLTSAAAVPQVDAVAGVISKAFGALSVQNQFFDPLLNPATPFPETLGSNWRNEYSRVLQRTQKIKTHSELDPITLDENEHSFTPAILNSSKGEVRNSLKLDIEYK